MAVTFSARDYSLVGRDSKLAEENGLASAHWYSCAIPRKELKALMQRKDGPAIRDTVLWLTLLAISGWLGWHYWGTWAAVPCFFIYGVLYGSASDSRWHECGHGTAFRTRWMNDAVYSLACFMIFREPTVWRWSHTRHHTDTIIVGRDPEIGSKRPTDFLNIALTFLVIPQTWRTLQGMALHCVGKLGAEEATFIPEIERWKVYLVARIYTAIILAVLATCIVYQTILPAMFIFLPTLYGGWFMRFVDYAQHAGLAEDVLDHRLNARTVYMNPVFRFICWNMNYHLEHHIFPMVPYHALPKLHEACKADCPPPYTSCWDAYREIIPAWIKQRKDPNYYVRRQLPDGKSAVPYNHSTVIVDADRMRHQEPK